MTKIDCFWVVQMMIFPHHKFYICEGCVIAENDLLQAFQAVWSWEKQSQTNLRQKSHPLWRSKNLPKTATHVVAKTGVSCM